MAMPAGWHGLAAPDSIVASERERSSSRRTPGSLPPTRVVWIPAFAGTTKSMSSRSENGLNPTSAQKKACARQAFSLVADQGRIT
ncbi:MAG: hypothetical protein KBF22_03085, partial [Ottowia sp.]|nr:hypothetical protein [Ottowia sp.]